MTLTIDDVKERLAALSYELKEGDEALISFSISKVTNTIKNDCNVSEIPDGLSNIAIDMVIGEFLLAKKTFAPDDLAGLDLGYAIKQLNEGDMGTTFAVGEGSETDEERLDKFIERLLTNGRDEFSCYRRLRW